MLSLLIYHADNDQPNTLVVKSNHSRADLLRSFVGDCGFNVRSVCCYCCFGFEEHKPHAVYSEFIAVLTSTTVVQSSDDEVHKICIARWNQHLH